MWTLLNIRKATANNQVEDTGGDFHFADLDQPCGRIPEPAVGGGAFQRALPPISLGLKLGQPGITDALSTLDGTCLARSGTEQCIMANPCNGSEPWRLIQCPAGKNAGRASEFHGKNAPFSLDLRESADVKGDFHETENYAKQNCNMLWNSMLQSGARPVKRIQTIALGSNHRVCGVICRDKRRLLWRG
jgi:hypothetical protein